MESSFRDPNDELESVPGSSTPTPHESEGSFEDSVVEKENAQPDTFPSAVPPAPQSPTLGVTDHGYLAPSESDSGLSPLAQSVFHPIDPRQVTLDRIVGLIFCACSIVGSIIGMGIYYFSIDSVDWVFACVGAGVGAILLLLLVSAIVWPPIEHRNIRWCLEPTGLEIRRGVFWKHQISIPTSRVQHVDVLQGPIQRNFGLSTLTIHTAGTANASIELAGLEFGTATQLRDQLVEQRETLNVV